ncbi:type I-E CRISPR-associated endoribonuclease Cas2e [Pseudoduganella namucuonensis]|uniref:CRISPR-associated protein Cas2 n=1 Tax=Pseudoduganella namucuonensis TaxID=1035707 RepID=A0A1I7H809_9BURK|nr:type I-E CRISPR-associated endoribonuclease Cas2e [Pseudoduganella namucuonensis]SFU56853.1 CRISPR-associated protein Cas2 [Pseudoduganella namucuonensis]
MVVVFANELPPAVRGRMKLWFIEPRANVFVSGIKDSTAQTVVDYLVKHCPVESGVMIYLSQQQAPGYRIITIGPPRKPQVLLSGLQLIVETLKSSEAQ